MGRVKGAETMKRGRECDSVLWEHWKVPSLSVLLESQSDCGGWAWLCREPTACDFGDTWFTGLIPFPLLYHGRRNHDSLSHWVWGTKEENSPAVINQHNAWYTLVNTNSSL